MKRPAILPAGLNRRAQPAWLAWARALLRDRRDRPARESGADIHAPLLGAADIAELAAQAGHLARAPARREVHDHHAGDWPSAWLGRGLDFEEARPYVPGDDLRDMDWRTTARLGHPFVKVYREERQPVLHLVLDRGPTMRFGTRRRLKAAQAARVAILAAFAAAERNIAVGATLWDSRDTNLPARHGRSGILELAGHCAAPCPPLSAAPPADSPAETLHDTDRLRHLAADLPRGARLLLISDFVWLEADHAAALADLAARADLLAIRVSDPAEHALPNLGGVRFHDMSQGEARWLETGDAAVRAAQAAAFAEREARADRLFARAGVAHLNLSGEVDDLISALRGHA